MDVISKAAHKLRPHYINVCVCGVCVCLCVRVCVCVCVYTHTHEHTHEHIVYKKTGWSREKSLAFTLRSTSSMVICSRTLFLGSGRAPQKSENPLWRTELPSVTSSYIESHHHTQCHIIVHSVTSSYIESHHHNPLWRTELPHNLSRRCNSSFRNGSKYDWRTRS